MRLTIAIALGASAFSMTGAAAVALADGGEDFEPAQITSPPSISNAPSHQPARNYHSPFLPPAQVEPGPDPMAPTQEPIAMGEPVGNPCSTAISKAEKKYNLPPRILQAISITESGQGNQPSPWAMNIKGRPHYAKSPQEVEAIVARYGSSASIDIGCAQVNLRWHGPRFDDWRSLINPDVNADYAAFHLVELKSELGSWGRAVAAYHSRTNWRGANYACTVSRNYGRLLGDTRKGCGPNIDALTAYLSARSVG